MKLKYTIWSNEFDPKYEDDYRQSYAERHDIPLEEVAEDDMWEDFHDCCDLCYEDECANLNKELDGRILIIASLGLWNGRRCGYKLIESHNLNEIMKHFCGDYVTIGYDGNNVVASDAHHDGTNYYTFREVREDRNLDNLLDKLYNGTATNVDVNRYTRALKKPICEVYGWK